jgi:hypothetical protein
MNFTQRVKTVCMLNKIKLYTLAEAFGTTPPTFNVRLQNGKFKLEEQRKIAKLLGCEIVIGFKFINGAMAIGGNAREMIDEAFEIYKKLNGTKMNTTVLAHTLNRTQQTLSKKILNDKLTEEEYKRIANSLDCEYVNYFILKDGNIVN